jgi:hypothetical protein
MLPNDSAVNSGPLTVDKIKSTDHSKLYQVLGTKYEVWILNPSQQCHSCQQWTVDR